MPPVRADLHNGGVADPHRLRQRLVQVAGQDEVKATDRPQGLGVRVGAMVAQKDQGVHVLPQFGDRARRRGHWIAHGPRSMMPGARETHDADPASAGDDVTPWSPAGGGQVRRDHRDAKVCDGGDHGAGGEIQVVVAGDPCGVGHGGDPGQPRLSPGDCGERIAAVGEQVRSQCPEETREARENPRSGAGEFAGDLAQVAGVDDREGRDDQGPLPATVTRTFHPTANLPWPHVGQGSGRDPCSSRSRTRVPPRPIARCGRFCRRQPEWTAPR